MAPAPSFAHYDEIVLYGPFHRLDGGGGTQTEETARRQLSSGEVWGRASRFSGGIPLAQAHQGPLPSGARGIEFLAFVPPDKRWGAAEWRVPQVTASGGPRVWREEDPILGEVVKVRVAITRVSPDLA
jgi:hypothetical protein